MIRIIDIETTGADPLADAIVEIASVDLTGVGAISNQQSWFVNPGRPIPAEASAIHHILDVDVQDAQPASDVAPRFYAKDAYFVAHNARFDRAFLTAAMPEFGIVPWICTMKCALRLFPDAPTHSNQYLRYALGLVEPFGIAREQFATHRAIWDAIVTAAIFDRMLAMATWKNLMLWSQEPALYTRFKFGKHKGERLDAVDPSYLEWIIFQSDMDDDMKFSARHALEGGKAAQ